MVYEKGFAIVGIGCRFPGGVTSLDGLWKVLTNGMDVVTSVPQERFDIGRYWHPDRKASGRTCSVSAGIVGDVRKFDAAFFGMSPKEAEVLDPQQRMVLEMAWEAFEDAGIAPSEAAGTKTAVYIGAASTDMGIIHADDPRRPPLQARLASACCGMTDCAARHGRDRAGGPCMTAAQDE